MSNKLFVLTIFLAFIAGCDGLCDREEMERITSADGRVDAVLSRSNCGATTSFRYDVFIGAKGTFNFDSEDSLFAADKVENLKIEWVKDKALLITYDKARILLFTNFWHRKELDNFEYQVDITEKISESLTQNQ